MTTGIYKLKFNGTDKCYIGQSINIELRYRLHCTYLRTGKASHKLQQAFDKYGLPILEILLECDTSELDDNENAAIEVFDSVDNGFNTMSNSGHRSSLKGELTGNSKYSNELVEQVFFELVFSDKPHRHIQSEYGIGRGALSDISSCRSHVWLKDKYPAEYEILRSKIPDRKTKSIIKSRSGPALLPEYPKVVCPKGHIYKVEALREFCRLHGLNHGGFGQLLRGKIKQHKGWTLVK